MKFGFMHDFRNPGPWHRPYPELYEKLVDQCVRAEELGFDNIWLTEHHFSGDYNPAPLHAATAIAARTERIRVGTFVVLLPFYDPIRLAEDVSFIDNLSKGRFDLGVGQGYRVEEFEGFGFPRKERSARLAEGIELVRRLWTEDRVTFEGRFRSVRDLHLQPEVFQKPHPPIWIGARTEKAVERAAREGYHLHLTLGPNHVPFYRERLKHHGRDPKAFSTSIIQFVYLAPTADEAWDDIQEQTHWMMKYYAGWFKTGGDLPGDEKLWEFENARDVRNSPVADAWMVGTPDQVAPKVEAFVKSGDFSHMVMVMQVPGVDTAKGTRSMELFAKEILPAFR
jgi:alkanesulfonate monooxygenase SsuD/methylene tetrahydromethanopterin reductase-like flavin-dependent oxidoreductase (luciferase family)